jgi:hypothetical protein
MDQTLNSSGFIRFYKNYLFLIIASGFLIQPLAGITRDQSAGKQNDDSLKHKLNIFGSEELMEVSLQFDLARFQKKSDKAGSLDGRLIFNPGQPDSLSRKVSIKARGEYRYNTCSFPPIQLNFKKPVYAVGDTGKIKKIKLVTHCSPGNPSDDYVLREYLVYKLYSIFTDTSFRVRLLRITYLDEAKKKKPFTQYGFLIEPLDILASRTNCVIVKAEGLTQRNIMPPAMDRIAIFNYMIANWDWSVPGQHNLAIVKSRIISLAALGIGIPYDFDLCGVVNADYGTPAPEMGLKSSRDRKFYGICRDRETFEKELKYFNGKKEELYSVVNDFPLLNQRSKKDITIFLDQFFNQFEKQRDTELLIENFLQNCKKL